MLFQRLIWDYTAKKNETILEGHLDVQYIRLKHAQ